MNAARKRDPVPLCPNHGTPMREELNQVWSCQRMDCGVVFAVYAAEHAKVQRGEKQ